MARKPAQFDKVLSRRVLVVIDRDMTAKTSRIVWQHEIPILEAIHGDDTVKVIEDESVMDEGYAGKPSPDLLPFNKKQDPVLPPSKTAGLGFVFIGDARNEYDRLSMVYGRHAEKDTTVVEYVYGRFQEGRFSLVLGGPEFEDLPEAQLRAIVKSYGASEEELAAAKEADEVIALAKSVGVEIA